MRLPKSQDIASATAEHAIDYQNLSARWSQDAEYHLAHGHDAAAKHCQEWSRTYHDAAWDRLARLIGVE